MSHASAEEQQVSTPRAPIALNAEAMASAAPHVARRRVRSRAALGVFRIWIPASLHPVAFGAASLQHPLETPSSSAKTLGILQPGIDAYHGLTFSAHGSQSHFLSEPQSSDLLWA